MSALRRSVRVHLERGEYVPVLEMAVADRRVVRALVSLLCDPDELLRWRAVSALGHLAGTHPELAQPLVTRLYWSLNDESGGIGWMSAPALGEIGDVRAQSALAGLVDDESPARLSVDGLLVIKQVREWAGEALARLRAA